MDRPFSGTSTEFYYNSDKKLTQYLLANICHILVYLLWSISIKTDKIIEISQNHFHLSP